MIAAKICGLSTPEAVDAALTGGAAFLGFMFFAPSPRDIDPRAAARLSRPASGKARIVAVTVNPDNTLLDEIRDQLRPDLIQLHGQETPSRAREVAQRTGAGVIKVLSVTDADDVAAAAAFDGLVDHLMFDARTPSGTATPGGQGASFDWALLSGHRFERPWFLAGGLNPWNLVEAVSKSGAPMVDVSSGVERGAGLKDPALIAAFLEAVRRA